MNLARCAYPNCGLTRLSTIHWTDDPNQEIAHGSHEYREPAAPLDGRIAVTVIGTNLVMVYGTHEAAQEAMAQMQAAAALLSGRLEP